MLKKGKIIILIGVVISVIILSFITKSFAVDRPNVVVVLKEVETQYWQIIKAGTEKGFRDFGIKGKVIAPRENSAEEQIEILEQVFKENPDVLIVSPMDLTVIPILEKFTEAKDIPVLLLDTNIPLYSKTSYIGTHNFELGKKAGSFLASQLQPRDKIAIVGGDLSFSLFKERIEGAKLSLQDAGIEIAVEKVGISNDPRSVKEAMTTVLRDYPEIKGVVTTHDLISIPVIKVVEEQGLMIPVIGIDGITEILELIEEGTLPGTVAQNPYDMGYLSVEAALKVTKGENVEKFIDSGVDIIIKENAKQRLDFYKKILK